MMKESLQRFPYGELNKATRKSTGNNGSCTSAFHIGTAPTCVCGAYRSDTPSQRLGSAAPESESARICTGHQPVYMDKIYRQQP